jgi:prepilin-type N-terminal cleavage/methylation domain-containing protein
MNNSKGFTLIELLVTVAILVILLLISIVSVNQSSERRYPAEAERLLIWLEQISQRSMLEGAAYGIVAKVDEAAEATFALHPAIYYRNRWVEVTSLEPFVIKHNGLVNWNMESQEGEFLPQSSVLLSDFDTDNLILDEEEDFLLPELVFLPDGYTEPAGEIQLLFNSHDTLFNFWWDSDESIMVMERREL